MSTRARWTPSAAGRPLPVPLLVVPPVAEAAGEQDYFPDQEVVARGLDIFLKSMRRHRLGHRPKILAP